MKIKSINRNCICSAIGNRGVLLRKGQRRNGTFSSRSLPILTIFILIACAFTSVIGLSASPKTTDSKLSPLTNDWTNMAPSPTTPTARFSSAMAYNIIQDLTIMYGGMDSNGMNGETWSYSYNNNLWSNLNPSGGQSARMEHAMVYDSNDNRIIIFGGVSATTGLNSETWEYIYESSLWQLLNNNQLAARGGMAMTYDSNRNLIYLHGGFGGGTGDTWAYNYGSNTWGNLNPVPPPNPSSRYGHAMVYDKESDVVILFGGYDGSSFKFDTWAYSPGYNMWTQMAPSTNPSARYYHSMVYDNTIDRIILFGGYDSTGYDDETWTYDYNTDTWEKREPSSKPSARYYHSMAYDLESDRVILFGGTDSSGYDGETWAYELSPPDVPFVPSIVAVLIIAAMTIQIPRLKKK